MPVRQINEEEFQREVLEHPGRVLVDFFAIWCPPCRALAPLLDRFAEEHAESVKVVKVDTDAHEGLAEEYGVRTIPTVISFHGGREVARAVNPRSRAALEELIQAEPGA